MPMSYQLATMSLRKRWTATFTSSSSLKRLPAKCSFNLRNKCVRGDVPSNLIQESKGLTDEVGASVFVEKAYALGQHSSSPVLNRPSEFFECLTIPVSVYCGPMSHEVDQQYPLSIPKHSWHDFAGRLCCFEFSRLWRRGMPPLT